MIFDNPLTHPDVDLWPLVLEPLEDLRGGVGRRAAPRVQQPAAVRPRGRVGPEVVGEAEVGDLDVHVGVQQQILGLEGRGVTTFG